MKTNREVPYIFVSFQFRNVAMFYVGMGGRPRTLKPRRPGGRQRKLRTTGNECDHSPAHSSTRWGSWSSPAHPGILRRFREQRRLGGLPSRGGPTCDVGLHVLTQGLVCDHLHRLPKVVLRAIVDFLETLLVQRDVHARSTREGVAGAAADVGNPRIT